MELRRRLLDFALGALAAAGLVTWLQGPRTVRAEEPPAVAGDDEFLLATGPSGNGTSLLFVLATRTRTLNVYEAEGGTRATRGLQFVASRKIERDLYVTGYNDRSEYSYQDLVKRFQLEEARAGTADGADEAPSGER